LYVNLEAHHWRKPRYFKKPVKLCAPTPEGKSWSFQLPANVHPCRADIKLTDRLIDLSETKEKKGSVDTDIVNAVDEQIRSICTGLLTSR